MDVNTVRIVVTVAGLVLFLLLVARTWSRGRQAEHQAAAQLPFLDDDIAPAPGATRANHDKQTLQGGKP